MPVREERDVAIRCQRTRDHCLRAGRDLLDRFAIRKAIAEGRPARPGALNIGSAEALVRAVVPFAQIRFDLSLGTETGEFACPAGALHRARQYKREGVPGEFRAQRAGLRFAFWRK